MRFFELKIRLLLKIAKMGGHLWFLDSYGNIFSAYILFNYFHMNPQTTNALTFLLHIILAIGGVLWQQPCVFEQN
jgi:hypothetical protein